MPDRASTPRRPGWYWDPSALEHNLALRERWRRSLILTEPASYHLRRWDGTQWSHETLTEYSLRRGNPIPHLMGPTTPIHPLTPEEASRNLRIWMVLMALGTVAALVSFVLR